MKDKVLDQQNFSELVKDTDKLLQFLKHGVSERGIDSDEAASQYALHVRRSEIEHDNGSLDIRVVNFIDSSSS